MTLEEAQKQTLLFLQQRKLNNSQTNILKRF